jgi:hypothetical protein
MSGYLISATAGVLEAALNLISRPAAWPDPASGFAYHLLRAASLPLPDAFAELPRPVSPQLLRRTPELAAFGYVIGAMSTDSQAAWAQAFGHLVGREPFPPDRNSFIHSPLELIGIASGVAECPAATYAHRAWLADTIQRGLAHGQFVELTAQVAAACARWLVSEAKLEAALTGSHRAAESLQTGELILLTSLAFLVPNCAAVDVATAEQEILARVLSSPVPARDAAEAAGLYVTLKRAAERVVLASRPDVDPLARVVALCRRFPLFIERLRTRQRNRTPLTVEDEYDVQDLLHAILKLHFEDVRPEEWTPSYAGSASRIDFLLPRERTIIEAKMTRPNLGQKEVANELIVDVARYAKSPDIDNLVCLVYDPARRCFNPGALEDDLSQSVGRLRVAAVICPRGL